MEVGEAGVGLKDWYVSETGTTAVKRLVVWHLQRCSGGLSNNNNRNFNVRPAGVGCSGC